MSAPWTIAAATERVTLSPARQGELTVTVTNPGPVDQRGTVDVLPGDSAATSWFTVQEPQQLVPHGGSVTVPIRIAVPADAAAGSYWLQGRVYSSDGAPEENSALTNRVAFDVPPIAGPPKRNIWMWLIPLAVLLAVVLGVVLFFVLRNGDPGSPSPAPTTAPQPTPTRPVHISGPLEIPLTSLADLDELVVGGDLFDFRNDVFFRPQAGQRLLEAVHGARIAEIGPVADPVAACEAAPRSPAIVVESLAAGDVLCVITNRGRVSILTVDQPAGPSPGRLVLSVTTFEA